ncbi:hypothetical protein ASF98_18735 [Arthrobacter sp. Leaf337]|uniref:hypothetical protein n=1 Tax=Arthrobacter sp. Leaf337 TaxID=1736342 RepID=UPI0006F231D9|nr:hypothetical protein [Arthrobacter sp. Leaf337]KQR80332.1 hypothetical protein ASF98_18735 [Arthrobacter sp. Leaf337]
MLTKFWEAMGGKLADRWLTVSVPALVFWFGGALAWLAGADDWVMALSELTRWMESLSVFGQLMMLFLGLLGIGASGVVVARATAPALRLIEGYWPRVMRPLARLFASKVEERMKNSVTRFSELERKSHEGRVSEDEVKEHARLDEEMRRRPARPPYLPTSVGNTLRAAERRPEDKYGLDAVTVWPHLWQVMPETSRKEVGAARAALDSSVGAVCWGLLFLVFTPLTWWSLPIGLAVSASALFIWVPSRAQVYADQVEALFDLYRRQLYEALRWPLPRDPDHEREQGRLLTTYLWRGLGGPEPRFTDASPKRQEPHNGT